MPRLVTTKIHHPIYMKLMDLNKDVNAAIKILFYTLKNDAEKAGAEKVIERNKELITENEKKIEELPNKKAKFEKDFYDKYEHQKKILRNRKKIMQLKLDNLGVITPQNKWETGDQWQEIQREELELTLVSIDFDLEELERKKEFVMEEEKQGENYDVLRIRLEEQNERLRNEIARFERIIELCNKLDIDTQKEAATYIG